MLKPTRSFRLLVGISGLLGVAALAVYYSVPIPVPPPNAGFREIAEFGTQFHDKILLDAWLQGIGSLLVVIFFLALVYLAQGIERFSGWITTLGATAVLTTTLVDVAFVLGAVQGAVDGHPTTALTCFDMTFVFIHLFPMIPASVTFLGLGAMLLRSPILPRVFAHVALALGFAFPVLGFLGLFMPRVNGIVVILLSSQEVWVVAAAITLQFRSVDSTIQTARPALG